MNAANRPIDTAQRSRAIEPGSSFIIQAPAGSGKTELLIQRMLRLLSEVTKPEEVLAITFTRKAAAEMSNRLIIELIAAKETPAETGLEPHKALSRRLAVNVLQADKTHGWNLLMQPSRLQIKTIDSLCGDIVRQMPVLSGLGGAGQIVTQPEPLYGVAARRTLAAIEQPEDSMAAHVATILRHYDNQYDKLEQLLTGMLGTRDQWLGHVLSIKRGNKFDRTALEQALAILVESQLSTAKDLLPDGLLNRLKPLIDFAAENDIENTSGLHIWLQQCAGGPLELNASTQDLPHWKALLQWLMTANYKSWRKTVSVKQGFPAPSSAAAEDKPRFKEAKEQMLEVLSDLGIEERFTACCRSVGLLPDPQYDDQAWESMNALLYLLVRAAEEWQIVAAESGCLDFTEVSARAVQALGFEDQPTHLALRLDHSIQHLLVDEFQDTSSRQVDLLLRLTAGWQEDDGRSLFLVGDPMQSIYRFRKAEVSLFLKAWEGTLFDQLKLEPLRLSVNFRSSAPIVNWVNSVFPLIMPERNDALNGAVRYSESECRPSASSTGGVHQHFSASGAEADEAEEIVRIIAQAKTDETIAILVRSRGQIGELLRRLDDLKSQDPTYRYQAVDLFKLTNTPLIQDLVSLTLALTQPSDRLAWLSVLRAPFCGLNLKSIEDIANIERFSLILDGIQHFYAAQASSEALNEPERKRLNRVAPTLLNAMKMRDRVSLRRVVELTWKRLGGPACLDLASLLDADTFFDLLDSLEADHIPIDREVLSGRLENLYAQPDTRADGHLKIMTIYAAKGLEFDRVIVPGLHRQPSGDNTRLLHWFEIAGTEHIVMSPMRNAEDKERNKRTSDLIQFISNTESTHRALENARLFYVMATRAKTHLHLMAQLKPANNDEFKPRAGSLLQVAWPAIGDGVQTELSQQLSMQDSDTTEPEPDKRLVFPQMHQQLPADWQLPDAMHAVDRPQHSDPEPRDYVAFKWAGEDARHTGLMVHRLLQYAAETPTNAMANDARLEQWCIQQMAALGIEQSRGQQLSSEAIKALNTTLKSEKGQWILADRDSARSEYALTAVLDGQPTRMILDRTFVEDGVRWIIDFKTSSHSGGDLEGFLDNEAQRYAMQMARYKAAFNMAEPQPVRLGLYFPMLDRFVELNI